MASLQCDYDFVEEPSKDCFCPVTLCLLLKPRQTQCCGHHLSQEAVTKLQGQPCPLCKEPNLITVPDKYFNRKINELRVCCPNKPAINPLSLSSQIFSSSYFRCSPVGISKSRSQYDAPRPFYRRTDVQKSSQVLLDGCEWIGELGNLAKHLSCNSVEGQCQFVTVACPYICGDDFKRCQLEEHKQKCPNRPFTCKYCGHKATYKEVTGKHLHVCKRYPLPCPNNCEEDKIERQNMEKHREECPLEAIPCEFSYAGCEFKGQRQEMNDHVKDKGSDHISMLSKVLRRSIEDQNKLKTRVQEQTATIEQQQKQIGALTATLNSFVPPPDIVLTNFEGHKKAKDCLCSPPFYSHIGGCKMCITVFPNGCLDGKGTHISAYVQLMQGEHDESLKWPFHGKAITIQLLNQKKDGDHWERTFSYRDNRVVGRERSTSGIGHPKFIAHTQLRTNYLVNDCLKFRVARCVLFTAA